MNKYEKAIDNVARYCSDYRTGIFPPRHELSNELDILMELVEKATPIKPILLHSGYDDGSEIRDTWDCPNCGETFVIEDDTDKCNYCPNCGQKLLWGDEQ